MKKALFFVFLALLVAGGAFAQKVKVETVRFKLTDDGWIRFFTNSRSMAQGRHQFQLIVNPNADPNVYEMEIKKISGHDNMTYGMYFASIDGKRFNAIQISVKGFMRVSTYVNGKENRTPLSGFNLGYNAVNTIKVVKNGDSYGIYLNGKLVYTLERSPVNGNRIGYDAGVAESEYEQFPEVPAEIWYKAK